MFRKGRVKKMENKTKEPRKEKKGKEKRSNKTYVAIISETLNKIWSLEVYVQHTGKLIRLYSKVVELIEYFLNM